MTRNQVLILAFLAPLLLLCACEDVSDGLPVLTWDLASDGLGADAGRDVFQRRDVHGDPTPWDPGFDPGQPDGVLPDWGTGDATGSDPGAADGEQSDAGPEDGITMDTSLVDVSHDASPTDAAHDARPDALPDGVVVADSPADVDATALSCSEILECASDCGYALPCVQQCIQKGDAQTQAIAQALLSCTLDACSQFLEDEMALQNCVIQYCSEEGLNCLNDSCQPSCGGKECGPDGCGNTCGTCVQGMVCDQGRCTAGQALSCAEIADCVLTICDGSDINCVTNCQAQGSAPAQEAFQDLLACILPYCSQVFQDVDQLMACVELNCATVYDACVAN